MPYIEIRAYPKDEKIKKSVAKKIENIFLEEWGCKKEAISISFEEVDPSNWEKDVVNTVMAKNDDKMYNKNGEEV